MQTGFDNNNLLKTQQKQALSALMGPHNGALSNITTTKKKNPHLSTEAEATHSFILKEKPFVKRTISDSSMSQLRVTKGPVVN